jgi:pimeloyl-ACP methyl ester carboxylesterase
MKKLTILILLTLQMGILKSEAGQLIEYNHQSTMSLDDIAIILWMAGINLDTEYGISVYDIKYETEGEGGYIDTLSGLVVFPDSPMEAFPMISYQHGTAVHDGDAPSLSGISVANPEVFYIALATAPSGFITLFPDYEGMGNPNKFHPYITAESYAHTLVNMLRAVKELSSILVSTNPFQFSDQVHLFGYSEGGYATLAAQRGIELDYADEFTLTSSIPMAGPYDLGGTMVDYLLSSPGFTQPYYIPYILTSHLWYYDGLDTDFGNYFEPFWADTLPALYDGTHYGSEINAIMPADPLDIMLPEVLNDFVNNENNFFRIYMAENTLLDWAPQTPTYLFHGMGDEIVPYENAQISYDTFMSNGAQNLSITLYPESYGGHSEVAPICISAGIDILFEKQIVSLKGDLNGDGFMSQEDGTLLLESILAQRNPSLFQEWAGDMDSDGENSVLDLLSIFDAIDE